MCSCYALLHIVKCILPDSPDKAGLLCKLVKFFNIWLIRDSSLGLWSLLLLVSCWVAESINWVLLVIVTWREVLVSHWSVCLLPLYHDVWWLHFSQKPAVLYLLGPSDTVCSLSICLFKFRQPAPLESTAIDYFIFYLAQICSFSLNVDQCLEIGKPMDLLMWV